MQGLLKNENGKEGSMTTISGNYQRLSIDSTDENKIINEIIMHCLIKKKNEIFERK